MAALQRLDCSLVALFDLVTLFGEVPVQKQLFRFLNKSKLETDIETFPSDPTVSIQARFFNPDFGPL